MHPAISEVKTARCYKDMQKYNSLFDIYTQQNCTLKVISAVDHLLHTHTHTHTHTRLMALFRDNLGKPVPER